MPMLFTCDGLFVAPSPEAQNRGRGDIWDEVHIHWVSFQNYLAWGEWALGRTAGAAGVGAGALAAAAVAAAAIVMRGLSQAHYMSHNRYTELEWDVQLYTINQQHTSLCPKIDLRHSRLFFVRHKVIWLNMRIVWYNATYALDIL